MIYFASPTRASGTRVRPGPEQFWAGGAATAFVAALLALVAIVICRWTLGIPVLAPAGDGAWGNALTAVYVIGAGCFALAAAGLRYVLLVNTPRSGLFFGWIMGLLTLAGVVYPFSARTSAAPKIATMFVDLALGVAITWLISAVANRTSRAELLPAAPTISGTAEEPLAYDRLERDTVRLTYVPDDPDWT